MIGIGPNLLEYGLPSASPFGLRKMPSTIIVPFEHQQSRHPIFSFLRVRESVGGDVSKDLHREHFRGNSQGEFFNLFTKVFHEGFARPSTNELDCVNRESLAAPERIECVPTSSTLIRSFDSP